MSDFKVPYDEIQKRLEKALTDAALVVEAKAKVNAPVVSGNLRRSISHSVNYPEATIGSNVDYAPYVEKGTGLYAADGNGRKEVPWVYVGADGQGHQTSGSHPQPFLEPAVQQSRQDILNCFNKIF